MKNSLSIIVPMYNVAPYVERCLRSLANQDISFEDYEIICVNDGSPDNCREIVESLQKEIPNMVLINQENQGVSMARNNALAIAKGKYMIAIDPDDYVVPNCLKSAIEQAEANSLDVLYCAFEIFDVHHQSIWRTDYATLENKVDNGYDGYFAVRGPKVKDPDRSVAMLYKMELLKSYQIDYPKDVPFLEDGLFLGKVFAVAQRVGYSDKDFYQRTTRPGSATNSELIFQAKSTEGFINALKNIQDYECNYKTVVNSQLLNRVNAKFIFLTLGPLALKNKIQLFRESLNKIKELGFKKIKLNRLDGIFRYMAHVYNIHPLLLYFLYKPLVYLNLKINK